MFAPVSGHKLRADVDAKCKIQFEKTEPKPVPTESKLVATTEPKLVERHAVGRGAVWEYGVLGMSPGRRAGGLLLHFATHCSARHTCYSFYRLVLCNHHFRRRTRWLASCSRRW